MADDLVDAWDKALPVEMRSVTPTRPTHVEITTMGVGDPTHGAKPVAHSRAVVRSMRAIGRLNEIPELRWEWLSPDPLDDLVNALDGIRLVNPRVRDLYDAMLGPDDEIQWLPGTVSHPDGTEHRYWVPHFPVHHDLLDHELSTFGPSGLPIVGVFSADKLAGHAVTAQPRRSLTTILSSDVADALAQLGATGFASMNLAIGPSAPGRRPAPTARTDRTE
jgi:hypothetical protein